MIRTQDEIVQQIKKDSGGFINFAPEVLTPYLDFDHVREYLKDGTTAADWEGSRASYTRESVLEEAKTYMRDYGWPKAADHRGISAHRTVQKMEAWLWLIGEDELVEACQDESQYAQYGAQILKAICEKLGWPMPDDEAALRMMRGEGCGEDDGCGCG